MTTVQASTTDYIENRTFDEIEVGDSATLVRTLRHEDIQMFAIMSGDINPAHVDPEYATPPACARSSPTACGAAR
jgi:phosphate acetyltransferase